ncbi:MAG: hypothetical protein GY906_31345 [bacterium]|nr:hypothetical protein [bacterium]
MSNISTVDNAVDSLKRIPGEMGRGTSAVALKGVLCWGWHAVSLLAHHRLRPARDEFDHWFWPFLDGGAPELDVARDSQWEERQRLSLLELLDILSEADLSILKPEFYQGWQDRTTRCRTLRNRAANVIGASVAAESRERLLLLLAAYHRLLRLPAPVEVSDLDLADALPALFDLLELLVDRSHDHSKEVLEAIAACREAG